MPRSLPGRLLAALLGLTLLVVVADVMGAPLGPLRGVGSSALGPLERVVAPDADAQDRLAEENARLQERVRSLEDDADTEEQLADLLGSASVGDREVLPARVVGIGRAGAAGPTQVTLGAGSRDGVVDGSAVVTADGLVGRVVSVTGRTSDVEVLGSSRAEVAVRVGPDRVLGSLTGADPTTERAADELVVTSLARDRVVDGDEVVTLGSPGQSPYPPGVTVGEVVSVPDRPGSLTDTAVVAPSVDLAGVDVVGVLIPATGTEDDG